MSVTAREFGRLPSGELVQVYRITAPSGAFAEVIDYGGAVVRLCVPDREGQLDDVVCGYDTPDGYAYDTAYQGALVGRVGNRIAGARFTLDGVEHELYRNDGDNSLHGGRLGFSHRLWQVEPGDDSLTLRLTSPDGDEGYPGCMEVTVIYRFTEDMLGDTLSIEYFATCDKTTPINLTNHTYFNLGGYASGDVLDHILTLDADSYLPTDASLIPTGEVREARGAFDFTARRIGMDVDSPEPDLLLAGGYDHCFVFNGGRTPAPVERGELYCPRTGRHMAVVTDRPCVQCYSANFMSDPRFPLKGGVPQRRRGAICLETQNAPDTVHHPEFTFSDGILPAGEQFHSITKYVFSVK